MLGTYFLQPNQQGGGSHVANCGYVTAPWATGRGVARAMCAHSLERARERGFKATTFNFVVSTNDRAVALWRSFGFEIVGRLPGAFHHPTAGFVDAFVMYRSLAGFFALPLGSPSRLERLDNLLPVESPVLDEDR